MNLPDLHYRSLAGVASDIASGALSSEEVTRHTIERIGRLEPRLHAFAHLRADEALSEAKAADARRARGEALRPLHGVPIAVKDLCAMAGTPTRAGGFFSTGFKPGDTATVVSRLQQAGAIVIGKAQLTEGAWGTHHPDIPAPVNPWVADRWSGSSSSGSGVSVAAGLAYGAIGTDTAGSIRFPSACNHLVGLKPTWGRVSRYGVFPLSDTFDHVGPMTRTVLDAALMFAAIAGADPLDPTSRDEPVEDWVGAAGKATLKGVRVGVDPAYSRDGIDREMAAALHSAIELLMAAGASITEVRVPDVDVILERAAAAAMVEAAVSHARTYPSERTRYSAVYSALLDVGHATTARDYAAVSIWRREFRGQLSRLFSSVDMLVAPVTSASPAPVELLKGFESAPPLASAPFMRFTIPFNLAGVPSLTLPMGRSSEGAPLGFQLIGPELGEAALLSAGAAYEAASGFSLLHPDL
ncbi:MAG: amidase [Alphaproteobacteria bacterium]|nr:amidase [Alphaproteobacteria bacterium]